VTADKFINAAIDKGQSSGLAGLHPDERLVYLISEAEVSCDINGIDTLLDSYPPTDLDECASAFAEIGASEIAAALREVVLALPAREEAAFLSAACRRPTRSCESTQTAMRPPNNPALQGSGPAERFLRTHAARCLASR
jgi:hypothetical protein